MNNIEKNKLERLEKDNKLLERNIQLNTTNIGMPFGPATCYIQEVFKSNSDDYIEYRVTIMDSNLYALQTKDDRKPDDKGNKHSSIYIRFLKRKTSDIPADFLRQGDIVRISGILSVGYVKKGENIETKNHFRGFHMEPSRLSEETLKAIEQFKATARETKRLEEEAKNASLNSEANTSIQTSTQETKESKVEEKKEEATDTKVENKVEESATVTDTNPSLTSSTEATELPKSEPQIDKSNSEKNSNEQQPMETPKKDDFSSVTFKW
jgi:hypothetical protein